MRKQLDVDLLVVIAQARAEERAAVVAWLRGSCIDGVIEEACVLAAEAIERGEHRREDDP